MRGAAADRDWARRAGALTVEPDGDWPADQLMAAERLVTRLVQRARLLVAVNDCVGEGHSACLLRAVPGGHAACTLAPALARVAYPSTHLPVMRDPAQAYLRALRDAAGAVYFCRRVEHASGRCFFSFDGPAVATCGRVLAASHGVGD